MPNLTHDLFTFSRLLFYLFICYDGPKLWLLTDNMKQLQFLILAMSDAS